MPCCKSRVKDAGESVSTCIKSRNPLGIIVLVLLVVSAAFVCTAYYITNINSHSPTLQPIPLALSKFISQFSKLNWCLNSTKENVEVTPDTETGVNRTLEKAEISKQFNSKESACLQMVIVIPGDYYPTFKNKSIFKSSVPSNRLIDAGSRSEGNNTVHLTYFIQHNLSTSTRHSRDVLVPAYINISSDAPLPSYIRDISTCQYSADHSEESHVTMVTPCTLDTPKFHVDQKWEHNMDVYISVDEGRINIHLMYTSYFIIISAISIIAYSMIGKRNKNNNKASKLPTKMNIVVY